MKPPLSRVLTVIPNGNTLGTMTEAEERKRRYEAVDTLFSQGVKKAHIARMFKISRQMVDTIIKRKENKK